MSWIENRFEEGLIVTSLDPMFHVGSNFMPAAARFLERFLPWLRERMLPAHRI